MLKSDSLCDHVYSCPNKQLQRLLAGMRARVLTKWTKNHSKTDLLLLSYMVYKELDFTLHYPAWSRDNYSTV